MTHTISPVAAPESAADSPPKVDIGIVTIRDDEFRAVLAVFPEKIGTLRGTRRAYTLRHADAGGGQRYCIAVLRLIEQGQGEAQDAARDLIDDLSPRLVLVVGIAGGRPSDDIKLGDVILSTRIHDFTVEARTSGEPTEYGVTGGPIDITLAALIANLAAREDELGDWTAGLPKQPAVNWTKKGQLFGPPDWQCALRDTLDHHHGPESTPRAPMYTAGPIASSDRLVRDPGLLIRWLETARNLLAIEMESGGVYRACRERCPMLAIRGISAIIGLKQADAWTKYACASAAAFACAFLRTRPIAVGAPLRLSVAPTAVPKQRGLIDFTAERQRHARFVGREDVLARLDAWIDGPSEVGWIVLTGGPGMGKSAILSQWLERREGAGHVVPHHFVRRQVADWDQPEVIAESLAAQIEVALPELRDADAKPERRLLELLGRVSRHIEAPRPFVVVVDGLDETRAEPGENPLPRFLPHVVPAGIRFLCATRPTYPHLNWVEARNAVRRLNLDEQRWMASNEAVIRGFWAAVASEYQPPLSAETMAAAIARTEGNVLHAVMLHDALCDLPVDDRDVDRIPRSLKELIGDVLDRAASHETVRTGLGLLCAAREALTLDTLTDLAAWTYADKQRFVRDARQLLLEEPSSSEGVDAYRPRHDWVRELIAERVGATTIRAHHATLAQKLATWPVRLASARQYALRHALGHRAESSEWMNAWQLATDMSFLEAKCRELGVRETQADVAELAERCRAGGDALLSKRFSDLRWALNCEFRSLRAVPEATAANIWNRLRRSGWSAEELDAQLRVPLGTRFLRVRYAFSHETSVAVSDLIGHSGSITACAMTADGLWGASASNDGALKVWDLDSGRILASRGPERKAPRDQALQRPANITVSTCMITGNGRHVVSAWSDGTVNKWDLSRGDVVDILNKSVGLAMPWAMTPDGKRMVSTSHDYALKLWDLENGRLLATFRDGQPDYINRLTACAVTGDGRRIIAAWEDGMLEVWDVDNRRMLTTFSVGRSHNDTLIACAIEANGRRAVSISSDRILRIWSLEHGHILTTLRGHTNNVNACAFAADGSCVVASDDMTLKVWSVERGGELTILEGHTQGVNACAVTADGRRLFSASKDRTLKVWDLTSRRDLATSEIVKGHIGGVVACALTADGRRAVSASGDLTLKIWDTERGTMLATLVGHMGRVMACAMTSDGQYAVSGSVDRTVKLWYLKLGDSFDALATLEGHNGPVNACVVTLDGQRIISASEDKTLRIWDFESGHVYAILQGHDASVKACAVTADGRRVISASADGSLRVWDLVSGSQLSTLRGHTGAVIACAVAQDSRRVVSASTDGTMRIWDLERNCLLAILEDRASACAVTADNRHMVSASGDGSLKIWDLETFTPVLTHRGDAPYFAVATSVVTIAAGDTSGGVWFFDWPL